MATEQATNPNATAQRKFVAGVKTDLKEIKSQLIAIQRTIEALAAKQQVSSDARQQQ